MLDPIEEQARQLRELYRQLNEATDECKRLRLSSETLAATEAERDAASDENERLREALRVQENRWRSKAFVTYADEIAVLLSDTGGADDGPGDMVCKAHDVPGCAECWEAELSDTGYADDE